MSEEEWIADNARQAAEALCRPEVAEELYDLLGGEPDPDRRREDLEQEVARLRLSWRPGS